MTQSLEKSRDLKKRLEAVTELLKNGAALNPPLTCVIERDNNITKSGFQGIKPLMVLLREDKGCFKNAAAADKIIGKAAALMLILGGASAVHGELMSQSAIEVLTKNNIYFTYEKSVLNIKNRDRSALCPMEKTVLNINDPAEAFDALEKTIAELMK